MRQCFNDLVIIWCGCGFHGYARYKNAGRRRERERRKETRRGTGMGNSSCVLDSMGGILNTTIVQAHVWGPQLRYVSFWGGAGIKTVSHEFMSELQFLKGSEKKMLFCSFCWFPLPVDSWDGSFLAWLMGSRWRRPVRPLLTWKLMWTSCSTTVVIWKFIRQVER